MMDTTARPRAVRGESYFFWRGGDVSRLEALSDAVFALSLTLLVVSLEVPSSFLEMKQAFSDLPAFAASFAILIMFWAWHYKFHRRYGLEDFPTVILNALLLFMILFYVFPLKFLFTVLFKIFRGIDPGEVIGPEGTLVPVIRFGDMPELMLYYGFGWIGITGLLALMNIHAYRLRDQLQLNAIELLVTRATIRAHLISVGVGILSVTLVLINGDLSPFAGMSYALLGPLHFANGFRLGKGIERIQSTEQSAAGL